MKKVFRIPMFVLAAGMAITAAFAFKAQPVKAKSNVITTYYFVGDPNSLTELKDPENWLDVGTACSQSAKPCTIDYEGSRPDFEFEVSHYSSIQDVMDHSATFQGN